MDQTAPADQGVLRHLAERRADWRLWIAICVYVLVAIAKKRLKIERDLHSLLQVLSVSLFEKAELPQLFTNADYTPASEPNSNQLQLFNL
jgi:hypothetical protein